MTVEFVRSPIDSATLTHHPDGSSTITCPGCNAEPGPFSKPPFVQWFAPDDQEMAEITFRGHSLGVQP